MTITVVISTYNHPKWLEKVLWGYESQTHKEFDIIISDDGSGTETREVIESFQANSSLKITHCWHEDNGFQKTTILNRSLVASESDYLILTDGDCIPRADFIETHLAHAESGYFLSGGYCKLNMDLSRLISQEDIQQQHCFQLEWLRKRGTIGLSQSLKVGVPPKLGGLADTLTPTKATWNGMNASAYRKDLLSINGFNEDMKYGGLDRELGERLWNLGLKSKQIRHRAICLHLDHKRGYQNEEDTKANLARRQNVIDKKIICCANGIETFSEPRTTPRNI